MLYEKIQLVPDDPRVYLESYVGDMPAMADGLLVLPGGGYGTVCSDREGEPIANAFLGRGINCFVLHYSVAPNGVFPRQLIEASLAMKYIRENAARYHVNPDRVFTVGFSAGGHLAASLGTLWHLPEVQSAVGGEGINRPTGMILCYAVLVNDGPTDHGTFYNLLGGSVPSKERLEAVSLDLHVDSRTSPAFFMHTCDDQVVPVAGALMMARAMTEAKVPFEMHIYPHAPHGVALGNEITACGNSEWQNEAIARWVDDAVYWMKNVKAITR